MLSDKLVDFKNNLISNIKSLDLRTYPFVHFKHSSFLSKEIYNELLNSFPSENFQFTKTEGYFNRGTQDPNFEELYAINPLWKIFFDGITSKEFISAIGKKLGPVLYKERGFRVFLPWVINNPKSSNWFRSIFCLNLNIDLKIDSIGKRGMINPHRDASRKLLTLMFYFPDIDWKKEWGGDTVFYKLKSNESKKKFFKTKWRQLNNVPKENLEEFYELFEDFSRGDFITNSISGLCANKYSYHSVNPINIDDTRQRKTVRMCLELKKSHTLLNKIKNNLFEIFNKLNFV